MIWQLEWTYNMILPVLNEIPEKFAQWTPTKHTQTLETLKERNQKGDEWLSKQNLDLLSTIEYKVIHLAQCKLMYDNYAFGNKSLKWQELEYPTWPTSLDYLKQIHFKVLKNIQSLNDEKLEELTFTHFNEMWSFKHIITVLIYHDAYHFGQICTLKNLYYYFCSAEKPKK